MQEIFTKNNLIGLVFDDIFTRYSDRSASIENNSRIQAVLSGIEDDEIKKNLILIKPVSATIDQLCLVHKRGYVESLLRRKIEGYLDSDTYFSKKTFEIASISAGSVITAVDTLKDIINIFCLIRPPGHHAEAGKAKGFCIFNNIAIGARYAQKKGYRKIFIIDFDAHHGNGTQHAFESNDQIFYFSTHQSAFYPWTGVEMEIGKDLGEGFTRNIPMKAGAGDQEYLYIYNGLLPELIDQFQPDLIMVSAGYDIHQDDPLTDLMVTDAGIQAIVRSILDVASRFSIPRIFVLEGGYNLNALKTGVINTLREMKNTLGG